MGDVPESHSSDDEIRHYQGQSQRRVVGWLMAGILLGAIALNTLPFPVYTDLFVPTVSRAFAHNGSPEVDDDVQASVLSPHWGPEIQGQSETIGTLSGLYGFHPDFIAAVIEQELVPNNQSVVGRSGSDAIGLFGPAVGGGQPPPMESVFDPTIRLQWGLTVLSFAIRESGGDLFTALSAYWGGWDHIDEPGAHDYATRVLDSYARAIVARDGIPTDMADRWTVAVEILAGNVPIESLILLGQKPVMSWRALSKQTSFAYVDANGQAYAVRSYSVPLGLTRFVPENGGVSGLDSHEISPGVHSGEKSARQFLGNLRVLFACLPGLFRYRDQSMNTLYLLSDCPQERP